MCLPASIPGNQHILTHLQYAFQFFSPLLIFVLFTGCVLLCLNESFTDVTCAEFMFLPKKCFRCFAFSAVMERSLKHTLHL